MAPIFPGMRQARDESDGARTEGFRKESAVSLRLKRKEIFRHPRLARRLEEALAAGAGVRRVTASHLTGRIDITHDPRCDVVGLRELIDKALSAEASRTTPLAFEAPVVITIKPRDVTAPPPAPSSSGEVTTTWHALAPDAVMRVLGASSLGLDEREAARRAALFGKNTLPEPLPPSAAGIFFEQFKSLPVFLLLGSAALSVATGGVIDAAVTLAVIFANAAIGYSTESASQRTILAMTKRSSWAVRVRRSGEELEIPSENIVPGDILLLKAGAILPADARIIATDDLMVDEALLTGESEPVAKQTDAVAAGAPLAERRSVVRRGTFVASGAGEAVVVATGVDTEIGRIEAAASNVRPPPTVLEQDLGRLGTKLTILSSVVCAGVLGLGVLRGRPMLEMLKSSVALAVAAVPEGLPAISTTALALELQRLRAKKVIARRLHAVEGLGAMRILCFDKTGTLTENDMAVTEVLIGGARRKSEALTDPDGVSPGLRKLLEVGALCSDVELRDSENGPLLNGSGTERAIVDLAMRCGIGIRGLRDRHPRIAAQLRNHARRMMATLHPGEEGEPTWIAAKGDPKVILDRCAATYDDGRRIPLDAAERARLSAEIDAMSLAGLRVLGLAYAEAAPGESRFDAPLTWLGAAGLSNPLRPGVREVISELQGAGIRTLMITGDQSATARAIATELDLSGGEPLQILDASDVSGMPDELLNALCQKTHVFARVSPAQKLDIVRALQADGAVVGMTGDGFNDAPAMKAADLAIAIGVDSAGAARDVADIIIDGDHIRHITDGVAYGRTVRANVRKAVRFMLSTNLSEILVIVAETLGQRDEIESPLELLWLNLVTDVLPGLGLALEPPDANIMQGAGHTDNHFFDDDDFKRAGLESLAITGATLGAHAFGLSRYGPGSQTRAFTLFSLITAQLLHSYSCRYDRPEDLAGGSLFSNRTLNMGTGAALALQLLPAFVPGVQRLLGLGRMSPVDFLVSGAAGLASFSAVETVKALNRKPRTANGKERRTNA